MDEHVDKCPECRAESGAIERLLKETEAVRSEIRAAAASVDWDALPGRHRRPGHGRGPTRPCASLRPAFVGMAGRASG